jgi:membrane protein required for beta-lactamase induction
MAIIDWGNKGSRDDDEEKKNRNKYIRIGGYISGILLMVGGLVLLFNGVIFGVLLLLVGVFIIFFARYWD